MCRIQFWCYQFSGKNAIQNEFDLNVGEMRFIFYVGGAYIVQNIR